MAALTSPFWFPTKACSASSPAFSHAAIDLLDTLAFSPSSQTIGSASSAVLACDQVSATTATPVSPTWSTCLTPGMPMTLAASKLLIFATVCAFDPQGEEMTCVAAPEPKSPVTQGWLRISQRKLDPQQSTEYLPYYPHDERQLLEPGEIYEVDLEIWPMGLALPKGSRLTLTTGQGLRATGGDRGRPVHFGTSLGSLTT